MNLDLMQIVSIARRRWWVVALMMVIAGAAAFASASRETKLYSSSATMMVTSGQAYLGAADTVSIDVSERLAETYPFLITSDEMYDRVAEAMGLDFVPGSISASVQAGSQLIVVSVIDTDPERAALTADTVVSEFEQYIAERVETRAGEARSGLDAQVAALESRVGQLDDRIAELDTEANEGNAAVQRQIEDLSQERAAITEALVDLNTQSVTIGAQMTASAARVEPAGSAFVPSQPFEPQPRRSALLGLMVGMLLGLGLVALLEYLDNTIKPGQHVQALTGAPLLATVPFVGRLQPGGQQVFSMSDPRSSAAEAIRLLRTNLEFAGASQEILSITITSPGQGEGKSTTAANLATVLAQAGLRTVLIDADLRKPTLSTIFSVSSGVGLTTLVTRPETDWKLVARSVAVQNLQLIPSGLLPPNPADLVGSKQFEAVLAKIKAEVDQVVIDSPPILSSSDALAIAAHTDGMILVAHANRTRVESVRQATEAIHQGAIRLIGVVLNRHKGQRGALIYGDYYYPASAGKSPNGKVPWQPPAARPRESLSTGQPQQGLE